jgi:hypothetical protein
VADLNGDGNPDLIVADEVCFECTAGQVSVLMGNGNGTFQTAVAYPAGIQPHSIAVGDLNGDGQVNCADLALVRGSFGKRIGQPGFNTWIDVNTDGVVDIRDLIFVTQHVAPGTVCP